MSSVHAPGKAPTTLKRAQRALALGATLALLLAIPVAAQGDTSLRVSPDGPTPNIEDRTDEPQFASELWFVEFESEPSARGGGVSAMAQERNALRQEARDADIEFEERYDFQDLWNGLSVRATASEAAALAELSSASAVYPVELIDAPEPLQEAEPHLGTALGMTGADVAVSELGFDGEGLSVAIIDTGIDYGHPDLGGDGEGTSFPTDRVTHGFDYVGDDYDASDPDRDEPSPNPDPMDINGHGTHVAGISGANPADEDGVQGVAPAVTFGAYKVFGTSGSSSADVIIAAMEDAAADGMDIINMSLGAAFAWGDYPTSKVANQLVADGTVVVASAGNSGETGVFSLGAPGNATDAIGVASADNLSMNALVMEAPGLDGPDGEDLPYSGMSDAQLPPLDEELDEVVWIGRGCSSLGDELEGDPEGATALIIRGECTFEEKYNTAVDAGATGVIIYNHLPGLFAGGGIVPADDVWAAATTNEHGAALRALAESEDEAVVTATERTMSIVNPGGGLVSSFSSYGMTPDLDFRPDILAPGGLIESTYPLASGGYATISGTSMSAPHVAGAVALLLDAQPDLAADEVRGVLQNSAEPVVWSGNPDLGILDNTFRQGAGMLQIDTSITATSSVEPSKIALGEAESVDTTLTITNAGDEAVTYDLDHVGALGTAGFGDDPWGDWATIFYPQFAGPSTTATFTEDSVTVDGGSSVDVDVTITNPHQGLYAHQAGGYLTVTGDDGSSQVVPFAGLAGELTDIEIWPEERPDAVGLDNALVAQYVEEDGDEVLVPVDPGHVFDRSDEPVAAVFMGFAAQELHVVARHVDSGHEVPVIEVEYQRRSESEAEYQPFTWDGREQVGNTPARRPAPRGEWVFELRALPVGEDASDEDAWVEETTESFEFRGGPPPGIGGPPPHAGPPGGPGNGNGGPGGGPGGGR